MELLRFRFFYICIDKLCCLIFITVTRWRYVSLFSNIWRELSLFFVLAKYCGAMHINENLKTANIGHWDFFLIFNNAVSIVRWKYFVLLNIYYTYTNFNKKSYRYVHRVRIEPTTCDAEINSLAIAAKGPSIA